MKPLTDYSCIRCLLEDWVAENPHGGELLLPTGEWGWCEDHKGGPMWPKAKVPYYVRGSGPSTVIRGRG